LGRYERLALLLVCRGQRVGVLLVKDSQGFDRLLVGTRGPMHPRTDVETVDVKPAELMNSFGQVRLHRLQVAGVHIGQVQLDPLLETRRGELLEYLADGLLAALAAALQTQNQPAKRIHNHHTQHLPPHLFEEDFVHADGPRQGNDLQQPPQRRVGTQLGLGDDPLHVSHRDVDPQPGFQDFDDAAHRAAPRQLQHHDQAVLHHRPLRLQVSNLGFQGNHLVLGLGQGVRQALSFLLRNRVGLFHSRQALLHIPKPVVQGLDRLLAPMNPHQRPDRQAQHRIERRRRDPQGVRQRPYRLAFVPNEGPQACPELVEGMARAIVTNPVVSSAVKLCSSCKRRPISRI